MSIFTFFLAFVLTPFVNVERSSARFTLYALYPIFASITNESTRNCNSVSPFALVSHLFWYYFFLDWELRVSFHVITLTLCGYIQVQISVKIFIFNRVVSNSNIWVALLEIRKRVSRTHCSIILPKPFIKLLLIITCKVYQAQLLQRKVVKPLVHVNWELISFLLDHVQRFNWNLPAPSMSLNIVEEFCFSSIVCSDCGCDSSEPLQKCQPRPWFIVNVSVVSSE